MELMEFPTGIVLDCVFAQIELYFDSKVLELINSENVSSCIYWCDIAEPSQCFEIQRV